MKRITILGSTGSIGVNTLRVISSLPRNAFKITALAANSNVKFLASQIKQYRPKVVCVNNPDRVGELKRLTRLKGVKILEGADGLKELAGSKEVDLIVMAISGNISLIPLIRAVEAGKTVALASKEPLVSAGRIIMEKAQEHRAKIIPVDSEHSAIFQCLSGRDTSELRKIFLTGTGGPLLTVARRDFNNLSPIKVARHPKWRMGKKISIDSATLMNKGLEVIEAMRLFDIDVKDIDVLIHPEAIVHSMVELGDGTVFAQLAPPDMRLPIQYALTFPERSKSCALSLDFRKMDRLTFRKPDKKKFPCLDLAYEAARRNGTYPAALNAANEIAVNGYLTGKCAFTDIPKVIERVIKRHKAVNNPTLNDIIDADKWARLEAECYI